MWAGWLRPKDPGEVQCLCVRVRVCVCDCCAPMWKIQTVVEVFGNARWRVGMFEGAACLKLSACDSFLAEGGEAASLKVKVAGSLNASDSELGRAARVSTPQSRSSVLPNLRRRTSFPVSLGFRKQSVSLFAPIK